MEPRRFAVSVRPGLKRLIALLPLLALGACSWFTDFKEQPKIDPWESSSDTIAFRANPQFSVPTSGSVAPGFEYNRLPMPGSISAMASIPNPVPADSASVNRGRVEFQINCAVCHGPLGMANGPATRYGMAGIAIGAGSNAANNLSDGYIFGMIRNGRGLMPPYNRIEESDRWDIVNYVRTLQGKGAIAADTTHCRPGETGLCTPGASVMGPTKPAPYYRAASVATVPMSQPTTANAPAPPSPVVTDSVKPKPPTDTTKTPEHHP
jgi:mono/diheme cytochrome c family protein